MRETKPDPDQRLVIWARKLCQTTKKFTHGSKDSSREKIRKRNL